jgi:hypothetical protein
VSVNLDQGPSSHRRPCHRHEGRHASSRFLGRWFFANTLLAGILSLAWLLLRTGPKPSRLAYPCQQAALSTATLALLAPVAAVIVAARRHVVAGLRNPLGLAAVAAVVLAGSGVAGYFAAADQYEGPILDPPRDYRAEVFHVMSCPEDPVGDRFPGVDALMHLMGANGLKIYRSVTASSLAGPWGIVGSDDVILIKINYQWDQRGGTNVDLLSGLIRVIVDHPDGFTGEVVVCENTQFAGADNFDRAANNAQDQGLSPRDVINHFAGLGHEVSGSIWTGMRFTEVEEYSAGNTTDGYVVYPWDNVLGGRVSYPKFQTDAGTMVSTKEGIWDPGNQTYNRDRLKIINLPVFKSHGGYGVTACVKNLMGLVTRELDTNSHGAIANGLMGAVMAEIRPPDLNILDAVWINAHPGSGPWTSYGQATRRNELVASVDPVAADIWAVTEILIPAFMDNGYVSWPMADPTDGNSRFREYLDRSMLQLLSAGYDTTNDLEAVNLYSWDLVLLDGFESGDLSGWSAAIP